MLAQPASPENMGTQTLIDAKPGLSGNANSLIGGVFQMGVFFGVLIESYVTDKYSGKIGANTSGHSITMFTVSRFLACAGS
jgi:hypothetical protein